MNTDIKWIKQALVENKDAHKELLEHVKKTNGRVNDNENALIEAQRDLKSHFFMHKRINSISRSRAAIIIGIINVIAVLIAALIAKFI